MVRPWSSACESSERERERKERGKVEEKMNVVILNCVEFATQGKDFQFIEHEEWREREKKLTGYDHRNVDEIWREIARFLPGKA